MMVSPSRKPDRLAASPPYNLWPSSQIQAQIFPGSLTLLVTSSPFEISTSLVLKAIPLDDPCISRLVSGLRDNKLMSRIGMPDIQSSLRRGGQLVAKIFFGEALGSGAAAAAMVLWET